MFDFIWIQMFSIMILMLQLTAAVTDHCDVVVRVGDEVTLSCGNVTDDQDKCNATTWLFTSSRNKTAITLFEHGDIHKNAKTKSHRLSVTANCSLVIKKLTAEDVGQYNCRKFKSENKQDQDIAAFLSLVNTSVTFPTSHNVYTSENYEVFKCQVREGKAMQQFSFRNHPLSDQTGWWTFILVGLGVAALLIIVVTFIRWKKTKENNPQMSKNTVEPETAVNYATISFTKKTASKAQVLGRNDNEEDDKVTYSIVKAPSSSSVGDPSDLYAKIK
ncbi:unnamed protein product [Oreochromis niloticus]|nr:unnamed protein product [Mustela putorius furo]